MHIPSYRMIGGVALLVCLTIAPTSAQPRRTGTYEMMFGYSVLFDVCGVVEHGRLVRWVIAETVARCEFPPEDKDWFHHWAVEFEAKAQADLVKAVQEHGGPPERLDGGVTCEQMRATAAAEHDRLARYEATELRTAARKCKPCEILPCPNTAPPSAPPARP